MIIQADARHIPLADESVQCVVTSPPYWGLRDYGIEPSVWGGAEGCGHEWGDEIEALKHGPQTEASTLGGGIPVKTENVKQGSFCLHCHAWRGVLGLEPTPELYVQHIVEVLREVKRVLRKDGTCWVNLGDSYSNAGTRQGDRDGAVCENTNDHRKFYAPRAPGLKNKDLVGIPWRVAFALQADGWWLRSDIIWSKPNPMPESVTDRPTKAHEYIFLLTKAADYYYDAEAIREPELSPGRSFKEIERQRALRNGNELRKPSGVNDSIGTWRGEGGYFGGRNKRSVWTVATQPYPEAHFATFPEDLIKPCILAGTSARGACVECGAPWERILERQNDTRLDEGGKLAEIKATGYRNDGNKRMGDPSAKTLGWRPTCDHLLFLNLLVDTNKMLTRPCIVLDPFGGSCTTVKVSQDLGRHGIALDLKPDYLKMGQRRSAQMGLACG